MPTKQRFDLDCSPDKAFDGFTDQARIVRWWSDPKVYETVSWTATIRVGGPWQAKFHAADGTNFGAGGVYLAIDRPSRLEWTWTADWEPDVEKTIQMSFAPSLGGTEFVIETAGQSSSEECKADEAAWTMIVGWFSREAFRRNA